MTGSFGSGSHVAIMTGLFGYEMDLNIGIQGEFEKKQKLKK
jgi:hypothetical protein